MVTPAATAAATVLRMMDGSPAWKPQAMLAEVIHGITPASSPMLQAPKDSPMSQLRSMRLMCPLPFVFLTVSHSSDSSRCCVSHAARACARSIQAKRSASPGRHCASAGRSTAASWAMRG